MLTTFAFTLSGGMLCVLATARTTEVAWRFLRLVMGLVLLMTVPLVVWRLAPSQPPLDAAGRWIVVLGAGAAFMSSVGLVFAPLASRCEIAFRCLCAGGGFLGLAAASLLAIGSVGQQMLPFPIPAIIVTGQILSGLLLGSVTIAWLLGHAYLTATSMTIAPLLHFSRAFSWSAGFRLLFVVASLSAAYFLGSEATLEIFTRYMQDWLILTLRILVGLVAVGIFAYMVSDCVKLRSTQSATGILYFGSTFVYVGELAGLHLLMQYGWPI